MAPSIPHQNHMLLPSKYLWCDEIDNLRLSRWLHSQSIKFGLPKCFYVSFINYCSHVVDKASKDHDPDEQQTRTFLSAWPMDADVLINEMKKFRATRFDPNSGEDYTAVDENTLAKNQTELYNKIFGEDERLHHDVVLRAAGVAPEISLPSDLRAALPVVPSGSSSEKPALQGQGQQHGSLSFRGR